MRSWTRILGIDPGFRVTGYGLIDTNGQESKYVASGVIRAVAAKEPAARLQIIFTAVTELVQKHQPAELAIERVFVHRNPDSALKLGQARSAAICATFTDTISVHEYAAREVKQAIVGKGSANKDQVLHMVRVLLNLGSELDGMEMDASDALGIALCHAHTRTVVRQYAEAMS
ncbi:MAG: crossover junction endodeoxyribonuclease RuvC [Gammaproteobacteria bacterium]|nr:crossover junction endodeoxyribonuclease RuvC [Gammaproteobacteria bacterium]MCP4090641.1 crossover junction endodeoxyribonuclease RuvC [Gammaproteobacteria bacterium]MCP4275972.1 crossover junction endodeoxyribonuclease RuvC [Gammaproteobacteria bacterium]MCP4832188.1 crossover junction endodeoxyribonuclease RuvC [Gammaproteobacteria bacterium]MCP4928175.1 crossover junction endodeoxyribonuclease RuvC [Gammaproteobacteria bacterium]